MTSPRLSTSVGDTAKSGEFRVVLDDTLRFAVVVGAVTPLAEVDVPIPAGCLGVSGILPATGNDSDVVVATVAIGGAFVGLGATLRRWGRRRLA